MANYTSQLIRRQQPQKPLNTEAIGFVLQSKEQKWNANQAKIDEKLSQIGSLDLIRDEDKQHVLKNVERLLGNVSNAGTLDYSSDTVARELDNAITGALDNYTIEQIGNTRKIKQFSSQIQNIKEKKPELYNDANYQYAIEKGGISNYMNGASDKIGNLEYTPYSDVQGKLQKGIKDLREYNKETEVEIPINDNGIRRILTKKVKDLNEGELRAYTMSQLGSQEQKQLAINGWANFKGYSDEQVMESVTGYVDSNIKNIESNISMLEVAMDNAPEYQKQDIQNRINIYNEEKAYLENNLDTSNMSRDSLERVYQVQSLVDDITRANVDTNVSYSLGGVDEAYYKAAELKIKELTAQAKNKPTTQQSAIDSGQIGVIAATAEHIEDFDPISLIDREVEQQTNNIESVYRGSVKPQLDSLEGKQKEAWNKYLEENKGTNKTEREIFQEFSSKTGFNPAYVAPDGTTRLFSQDVDDAADAFSNLTHTYKTSVNENFEGNIEDVYREATSEGTFNNNEFPVVDEDGNKVAMDQYLKGVSLEDFKQNKGGVKDIVRENLYKNKAFSELIGAFAKADNFLFPSESKSVGDILTKQKILETNRWLDAAKEGAKVGDYFDFIDWEGNKVDFQKVEEGSSVGGKFVPKTKEAKAWMTNRFENSIRKDTQVIDDSKMNSIITMDSKDFNDKLEKNYYTYRQNALYIRPNLDAKSGGNTLGDVFQKVSDAITASSATTGSNIAIQKKKPFIIQENPNKPEYVIISQPYSQKEGGEVTSKIQVGEVLKSDIESQLGFKLNTRKGSEIVNNLPVDNQSISYIDTNISQDKDKGMAIAGMASKGELTHPLKHLILSKSDLKRVIDIPASYNEDRTRTESHMLAENIVENMGNIGVKYIPKGERGVVQLYNKNNNREIKSISVNDPQRIKAFRRTVKYVPQQFIGISLQEMIGTYKQGDKDLYNRFLKTLE